MSLRGAQGDEAISFLGKIAALLRNKMLRLLPPGFQLALE